MKTFTVLGAVIFSAAATVWTAGSDVPLAEPTDAANTIEPSPEWARPTQLSDAIRQFVWDLRQEAIDRWFHDWNDGEPIEPESLADDAWWDDARAVPEREAAVAAEAGTHAVSAVASGQGTAISMAVVGGQYEIEAVRSGRNGPERFRVRGTRPEVERWAAELPQPLRDVVRRQLASADLDVPVW